MPALSLHLKLPISLSLYLSLSLSLSISIYILYNIHIYIYIYILYYLYIAYMGAGLLLSFSRKTIWSHHENKKLMTDDDGRRTPTYADGRRTTTDDDELRRWRTTDYDPFRPWNKYVYKPDLNCLEMAHTNFFSSIRNTACQPRTCTCNLQMSQTNLLFYKIIEFRIDKSRGCVLLKNVLRQQNKTRYI